MVAMPSLGVMAALDEAIKSPNILLKTCSVTAREVDCTYALMNLLKPPCDDGSESVCN